MPKGVQRRLKSNDIIWSTNLVWCQFLCFKGHWTYYRHYFDPNLQTEPSEDAKKGYTADDMYEQWTPGSQTGR